MKLIGQIIKKITKKKDSLLKPQIPYKSKFSDADNEKDYAEKSQALERILGPMEPLVGHAIIPYQVGGPVDMYYFSKTLPGTAFVTLELLEPDGTGPLPNRIGTYELIAFTKIPYQISEDPNTLFNEIENRIRKLFTITGRYGKEAVLNPLDTCEYPLGEGKENACVFFDEYKKEGVEFKISGRKHHLLLLIEVFRSEMEYAMKNGTGELIKRLKAEGHYPYSDLDREPVV